MTKKGTPQEFEFKYFSKKTLQKFWSKLNRFDML